MKQAIILFSSLFILSGSFSCKKTKDKINEATVFTMDYSSEVSVPSSSVSVTVPAEFTSPDIPTTSSERFASEKTTKDLIDEITLTKFTITSLTGDLDYIKSISIFYSGG